MTHKEFLKKLRVINDTIATATEMRRVLLEQEAAKASLPQPAKLTVLEDGRTDRGAD